jgi:hypothetical protein
MNDDALAAEIAEHVMIRVTALSRNARRRVPGKRGPG